MTPLGPAHRLVTGASRWWALASLTGANLLVFASVTIMNVALPSARPELDLSTSESQLVVTLYSLTFGSLILLGGRVADVFGLRRCLIAGLFGFTTASLIGGTAPTAEILLLARAAQGVSGAFVAATAVSLMSVTFPSGRDRRTAFVALGIVMGLGTAGSFSLAGALVDLLSWRWCLLINVPVSLILIAGIALTAPAGPKRPGSRVDIRAAVLLCGSLGLLVLGLDRSTTWGWAHAATVALLVGGVIGLLAFGSVLRRSDDPLVPAHLLADRNRATSYVAAAFVGVAMFAGMFVLTNFLQGVQGFGPVRTGLAFAPFAAGAVVSTVILPTARRHLSASTALSIGLLLTGTGMATFAWLAPGSQYATGVLPAMLLLGAGGTIVMITAGDVATADAGVDSGVAGSLVNSAQQIGAALGTALLTSVANLVTQHELASGSSVPAATVAGYSRAGLTGTLLLIASTAFVFALPSWRSRRQITGAAGHHRSRRSLDGVHRHD